jgi:general secretion pathway protein C
VAFDTLLKKYFALVVLALVAVAAYFQASGTMQLIGASLSGGDEQLLAASPPRAPVAPIARRSRPTAEPIIDRNPFDSVTGPLKAVPVPEGGMAQGQLDLADPLAAPGCDGVKVLIVTESTDPTWSIAALQGPGEPYPKLRRVGDKVSDREVAFIGFNPRQASPSVWMTNAASLCQSLLFLDPNAAATPPPVQQQAPSPEAPPQPPGRGAPTPVPAEIASKIQKISDSEFHVDRAVVDKILENQAELMKSARIVPEQKDGKTVGIRLFGIRPNTLLGTLGFQNGDRLEQINGFDMASPEKALEAYARLRTANNLNVKVNRRGKPQTIDYRIK